MRGHAVQPRHVPLGRAPREALEVGLQGHEDGLAEADAGLRCEERGVVSLSASSSKRRATGRDVRRKRSRQRLLLEKIIVSVCAKSGTLARGDRVRKKPSL